MKPISTANRRGRPKGRRSLHRGELLAAARDQLATRAPQELNLRQLALSAGVTPALAHYYFGNREGLIDALLAEQLAPRLDELVLAARTRAHQPQQAITMLLQRTSALLAADHLMRCLWMPLPAAAGLRDKLRGCLRELLARAQQSRALREDLSPDYLADSLLGLVLFHFVDARPITAGSDEVAALMLQHIALLRDGIQRQRA